MRKAFLAFALFTVTCGSFAVEFRGTSWLMTRDEVLASESGNAVGELDLPGQQQIIFRSLVNGFPATITYLLENDKLLSASYTFRRDTDRGAFDAMKRELVARNGAPAFEEKSLLGWRLAKTEIALAYLKDGTTYVAYWEKGYFARINNLSPPGNTAKK